MNYYLYLSLNLAIYIAGIIALIRFKKIESIYYPVIICFWIAAINETLNIVLILNRETTTLNNNVYVLIESILLTVFFAKAGLFRHQKMVYYFTGLFLLVYVIENFIAGEISRNSTYFRIIYSFIIVLMSISLVNRLIFSTNRSLWKHASFILCLGFIVYFTYKVLMQSFVLYGIEKQSLFLLNIYLIMIYINLGTNLLYAYSVLWMHKRTRFLTG